MKLIFIILLIVPCFLKAQSDTVGVQRTASKAGTINIDTIRLANNSGSWVDLYLTGTTTSKTFSRAKKSLYITNANGVYKIANNSAGQIAFTGLTGASWSAEVSLVGVIIKIIGTSVVTDWKLTRLNY